ncbi:MAG: hypothetical protein JOY99_09675 [Sphingomonadaceae bacterium]|nr:hypothetical protein [Sphingomonadaceae bacterium]
MKRMLAPGIVYLPLVLAGCADRVGARPPLSAELRDYLIEDVCIGTDGTTTADDPATCAHHRDIAPGAPSPYLVTDFDTTNGATYSAMTSLPVTARDGTPLVLVTKAMEGGFGAGFRFGFDPARDGYDLVDLSSADYVSFVRTSDGGCYDQLFARRAGARTLGDRAGGWVLFPRTAPSGWPQTSSINVTTYKLQLTPGRPGCRDGHSTGRTYWNRPAAYRFETGKTLFAIRSDHFANSDLAGAGNALERFYFTREYGFTRWEAWVPLARCRKDYGAASPRCDADAPDNPLRGRCNVLNATGSGGPGRDRWGGRDWVRIDCRDQTRFLALATPQHMTAAGVANGDGVDDLPAR